MPDRKVTCPTCHGTGDYERHGAVIVDCPDCHGSGEVWAPLTEREITEIARWLRNTYPEHRRTTKAS